MPWCDLTTEEALSRKEKNPSTIGGHSCTEFSTINPPDVHFTSAGDPLRIAAATWSSSLQDAHKWWQVCVRGRLQMTHLSFYFQASFGHHPSMRGHETFSSLQSCLCWKMSGHAVLNLCICFIIHSINRYYQHAEILSFCILAAQFFPPSIFHKDQLKFYIFSPLLHMTCSNFLHH